MAEKYIGRPLKRREDGRFLTGQGRFVDDITLPNICYLAFVRSKHAHARIRGVSTGAAAAMDGVLAVLTAEDAKAFGIGALPIVSPVVSRDGSNMVEKLRPIIVADKARHVGDIIAAVVAETRYQALDASEAVEVDYDVLPSVSNTARALDQGVPLVHDELGSNLAFDIDIGVEAAVEQAFAKAAHVTELNLINNRITANSLEPRCAVGNYEVMEDRYTLYSSTQIPHLLRRWLAENSLNHPEHLIRVVAPDVGGGFGMKVAHYPEEAIVLWASKAVGRPVRWTATRSEALISDAHARDHVTTARMAFDGDGKILGIHCNTVASLGAYLTPFGASIPAHYYGRLLVGLYKTPHVYCRVKGVYTHTVPTEAYRGAGRPEAIYVLERLVENGAREMGIDVCEIRSRNFIQASEFPYETPLDIKYDSADPPGLLEKVMSLSVYGKLREDQKRLREQGTFIGIGLATFIDCAGAPSRVAAKIGRRIGGWDSAFVRVHPSGKVNVFCGTHSHGQGHATAFTQIAADRLGIDIENIQLIEGDTDRCPYGFGTWGSRSLITSGMAIVGASDRIVEKCKTLAAHLLECERDDIDYIDGNFTVKGTDAKKSFKEISSAAYHGASYPVDFELGLEESVFYDPLDRNFPSAMHLAAVEVDQNTGKVSLRDYFVIDDCGTVINPLIVEGQVHGGLAQGIGQALFEDCTYDNETGQLLAGSFMDYGMPRSTDLLTFKVVSQVTPTPNNALGVKGSGESGTIGAPAAMGNAVVDALWHLGVRHVDLPMNSRNVCRAINAAKSGMARSESLHVHR
jgi:carbon-monoxide dehydrogenase large subunit